MKLYFLQRTELADRVVGAFRVAVVEETEAAELIESKTAKNGRMKRWKDGNEK